MEIKYTTQGDLACSWCGYLIPHKGDILQDWISAKVSGMYCGKAHAHAAEVRHSDYYQDKPGPPLTPDEVAHIESVMSKYSFNSSRVRSVWV